jgi:nitrous oxidase accessory protein
MRTRTELMIAILLALALLLGIPSTAHGAEIVVEPGTAVPTLAAALALARDGDVIRVRPGVYREGETVVDRRVELVGEGWPVLDGGGANTVLTVTADGVRIRGFVLRGAGASHVRENAAIRFERVRDCVADGNRMEDNFFGVYLAKTIDCVVYGNVIRATGGRETTSGNGIHLWNASGTRIERNAIRGHRDGIYLEFSTGGTLRDNRSEENLRYGLHFMFSNDNAYDRNLFRGNGAGVAVMYSKGVRMHGNRFVDNRGSAAYGLLLKEITDSEITGNRFHGNTIGIYSEGAGRVLVSGNDFRRNGWAVKVMSNSQENHFTGNNFIDNSFDVATNTRRNPNRFSANHWSRYEGYDLNRDGTGDVPHRPVRLFSLVVERHPAAMVLLRTLLVELLDVAERVVPALTPEALVDDAPLMREVAL